MRRCENLTDGGCENELTGRADARYCSNACRQAAYRHREAIFSEQGTRDWNVIIGGGLADFDRVTASSRNGNWSKREES